jgi:hypothetical protein
VSSAAATPAVRLSELLAAMLEDDGQPITFQRLVDRAQGRGGYLLIVLLCLPFTTPVPLPGVSMVAGCVIAWIAWIGAHDGQEPLPRWLGNRVIPLTGFRSTLGFSQRWLGWIERCVHPRGGTWIAGRSSRRWHAALLIFLAVLLLLPLPVPFTNALPGYSLMLVSVCLLERDARLIFLAYAPSLAATLYVLTTTAILLGLVSGAWSWLAHRGSP